LDPPSKRLSSFILNAEPPYNLTFYDYGRPDGLIIDNATYSKYEKCPNSQIGFVGRNGSVCVDYTIYDNKSADSNRIDISADVSKWVEKEGLHTIYAVVKDKNGTSTYATSLTLEYLRGSAAK
jgi:hypothetical protein